MASWDSAIYDRFENERNRPSVDLLGRVRSGRRRRVVDLGCGSGLSTANLAAAYQDSEIVGIDNSEAMLAAARTRLPGLKFENRSIVDWRDPDADLVFANAVFHWVPGHIGVLARIAGDLPSGGSLAVQMPDNEAEPSHGLMREIAARAPFREKLADARLRRETIGGFADYDDALSPFCRHVDIWRTTYVHRLAGTDAIVSWVEGAGLRPFLDPLDAEERAHFLALYREEIAKAYPSRPWGGVLLPFPRLFIVAERETTNLGRS